MYIYIYIYIYINSFRRFHRRTLRRWFWRTHKHVIVRICHFKSLGESVGNLNGEPVTSLYGLSFWVRRKKITRQNLHVSDPPFFFNSETFPFVILSVELRTENGPSVVTDWITDGKVSVGNFDLKLPTEIFRL